ncbi:MAG: hypothetical protein QXD24_02080 [Candidatus Caldarchaeum sp.]
MRGVKANPATKMAGLARLEAVQRSTVSRLGELVEHHLVRAGG